MVFKSFFYRIYQSALLNIMHMARYNNKVISGKGTVYYIPDILKKQGIRKILVITGPHILKSDIFKTVIETFKNKNLDFVLFYGTSPETGIGSVECAKKLYIKKGCSAIVAIGGGSVIDCAKAAAGGIANPGKNISRLSGYQKVRKKIPVIVAVPTTAGTGAETTACAVIKDINGHKKIIADTKISPKYAVLDPLMTQNLPQDLTAYTGMDALTHATESYINMYSFKNARKDAETAVKLIVENITSVYYNNGGINARQNMLEASYLAGRAFTRTSLGYVHAISHAIGSKYYLPHGMVVSVVLPYVLEWYGRCIYKNLAQLSDISGISKTEMSEVQKAKAYISFIKMLDHRFGINTSFYKALENSAKKTGISKKECKDIARCALAEANPCYPVPKIMNLRECECLVYRILNPQQTG